MNRIDGVLRQMWGHRDEGASMGGQELEHHVSSFRYAGLTGDVRGFVAHLHAAKQAAHKLREFANDDEHVWRAVLRFDLETADVPAVLGDLALSIGSTTGASHTKKIVSDFIGRYANVLLKTQEAVFSITELTKPQISADLCIGTWFRLLLLPPEFSSSRDIWRYTVDAAVAEAEKRGRSIFFLPDYAIPLVNRDRQFLSFHSYGAQSQTLHFKPSDFPRRVILDHAGYSGWSTLANSRLEDLKIPDLETVGRFYRSHREEVRRGNISKYSQNPIAGSEGHLPKNFIFVALQVAGDQTQTLARLPMLEMLDVVIRRFKGSETAIVVKRHPKCQDPFIAQKLETLIGSGDIFQTDASIHHIIPLSRGVCTVNSGVGSEAIVYLKPIYLFGEADYNCIAYRITSYDDFVNATQIFKPCQSEKNMKRFLYYYRNIYQIDVDDSARLRRRVSELLFPDPIVSGNLFPWHRCLKAIAYLRQKLLRASTSLDR